MIIHFQWEKQMQPYLRIYWCFVVNVASEGHLLAGKFTFTGGEFRRASGDFPPPLYQLKMPLFGWPSKKCNFKNNWESTNTATFTSALYTVIPLPFFYFMKKKIFFWYWQEVHFTKYDLDGNVPIIFGKMLFLLIWTNEFFHEIKHDRITGLMDFMWDNLERKLHKSALTLYTDLTNQCLHSFTLDPPHSTEFPLLSQPVHLKIVYNFAHLL